MINVGTKAPFISCDAVVDGVIKKISLHDFRGSYKLLFFYPLDFTFVCPTELHALQDSLEEFKKRGTNVLAISVDSVYSHLAWLNIPKNKGGIEGIQYPLLADITKSIAREYGVLHEQIGVALRGTFLIDQHDVIQYMAINNLPLGRNVPELVRLLDALIYTENNGEVCPANWNEGKKAMQPTQDGLQAYFG